MVLPPMESVCGVDEAGVAGSSACQVYVVLLNCSTVAGTSTALAADELLVSVKLSAAPEEAQPHTFASCGACCSTMCELYMSAKEALASGIGAPLGRRRAEQQCSLKAPPPPSPRRRPSARPTRSRGAVEQHSCNGGANLLETATAALALLEPLAYPHVRYIRIPALPHNFEPKTASHPRGKFPPPGGWQRQNICWVW
jgi:hypothetical protein